MFLILVVLALVLVSLSIWALIDVALKDGDAFTRAGSSKVMWLVLIVGFTVIIAPIGVIMSITYLSSVRRRVNRFVGPM